MTSSEDMILEKIESIVSDVLDRPVTLTLETDAKEVEGWDSVNHINIITVVEMVFGIKFRTSELEDIRNVGELVELVRRKT